MSIKEIKLSDLAEDLSFLNDLREGNFVLVLGAGFTRDVVNKNVEFNTIPTAAQFVSLTNEKFSREVETYEAAASVWEAKIKEDIRLLEDFRNLFLADENKFDVDLYQNIFIPNWYNVFTFNFDNVLEVTQDKCLTKKYTVRAYPDDSTDNNDSCILHLHGLVKEGSNLDNIVFTSTSYTRLADSINNLYNVLYGDVNTNTKNLIIVGTQFNEPVVFSKFFDGLKRPDIKIYHFDLKNADVREKPEFYERDYTFVKLEDDKGNKGTRLFLEFLGDNRHKIRQIVLDGALTIDQGFIDGINKGEKFSKTKFYSAKQDDNCQWYGILNDFDVVRQDYQKIKDELLNAFSTMTVSKVVAIVHGTGGCGKSTLLRRLALELAKESDFEIIWVKDRQLGDFVSNALPKIRADLENKYLIFVEDWYRLTADDQEIGKILLDTTQTISNIHLVIGDRDIRAKDYLNNLVKSENIFELTEAENKNILEEILAKHVEWKPAAGLVLKNPQSYNSPLFLILFAIVGVSEKRIGLSDVDFSDLENTVRRIAKYDLRKISEHYPGLAKALHYWGCVYETNKIFISYQTFLEIANHYNDNQDISKYFTNWEVENETLKKVKLYLNLTLRDSLPRKIVGKRFIQFNHDKLAESVLSKVDLEAWEPYDDIQKKKILDIITDFGDEYSASVVLRRFLIYENQIFENGKEAKSYIDKLFYAKGNKSPEYLSCLPSLKLSSTKFYEYVEGLEKDGVFFWPLWREYFKIGSKDEQQAAAKLILIHPDLLSLPWEIVITAFHISDERVVKQAAAKRILTQDDLLSLPAPIIKAALNISRDFTDVHAAVKLILTSSDLPFHYGNLVALALNKSKDIPDIRAAAERILTHSDLLYLDGAVVAAALNKSESDSDKRAAIKVILSQSDLFSLPEAMVMAAFNNAKDNKLKREATSRLLKPDNMLLIPKNLTLAAFKSSTNNLETQAAAKLILTHPDLLSLSQSWVIAALSKSENHTDKRSVTQMILRHADLLFLPESLIVAAFNKSEDNADKQAAARRILTCDRLLTLPANLVVAALNRSKDYADKQAAATLILTHADLSALPESLVVAAFNKSKDDAVKQTAATLILTHADLLALPESLVVAAFNKSKDDAVKQTAATLILTHADLLALPGSLVVAAFNKSKDDAAKQAAAARILKNKNLLMLPESMVMAAFNKSKNNADKQLAARLIITHEGLRELEPTLFSNAFDQPGNDSEKQAVASKFLSDPNWNRLKNMAKVIIALRFYSLNDPIPDFVNAKVDWIVNSVVREFRYKGHKEFFYALMSVPFHGNHLWKAATEYIISNWNKIERRGISNVLHGYITCPTSVVKVSEAILKNWKTEIVLPIRQSYRASHYGNHIKMALGHPDPALRRLAKEIAQEIVKAEEEKSVDVPDYLLEIAEDIINEGIFPEWESGKGEKPIP